MINNRFCKKNIMRNKKIISLLILFIVISAIVIPIVSAVEQVDQKQTNYNFDYSFNNDFSVAQSFKPSKSILTKVDVFVSRDPYPDEPTENLVLHIRSSLYGSDLRSKSLPPGSIPTNSNWVTFDFTDLSVTPEQTYYIILSTTESTFNHNYAWSGIDSDADKYLRGEAYFYSDYGGSWDLYPGDFVDWAFKTYYPVNVEPPTVTTVDAINEQQTSATLKGDLVSMGGDDSCDIWFEYGLTESYGYETMHYTVDAAWPFQDDVTGLTPGETYHFRAVASNTADTSYGNDMTFTTLPSDPDNDPPVPYQATWSTVPHATSENSISMVATAASDPSGVEYYFKETSGNSGGSDSDWQSSRSYTDNGLSSGITYTYKVKTRDKSPNQNTGEWSISKSATTYQGSLPPYEPNNPSPGSDATDIDVNVFLHWEGGDPNTDDIVKYDVFFGRNQNDLDLVSEDQASKNYVPGTLEYLKDYYWKIIAKDNHGHSTTGPIWHFTTEDWDYTALPDFHFPRATKAEVDKLKLDVFIPVSWDLGEGYYPNSYGYMTKYNKYDKTAESRLYDEHCGAVEPTTGVGIPETYVLSTKIGHKYTFPSYGDTTWTPPCKVTISGNYGMDDLAGFLKTSWFARAEVDISLVIVNEGYPIFNVREFQIDHCCIGPIEDSWPNIKDNFNKLTNDYIYFQYGQTYYFYLQAKASLFLTSQGLPACLNFLPVDAVGWGVSQIGAKYDFIKLIWQDPPADFLKLNMNGNLEPTIPDQGHGSTGIVNEEHTFISEGSTDPNGDSIFYKWHWDDGTTSEWIGTYNSGSSVTTTHTYTKPGVYNVRLEAKDEHGAWSGLSENSFNEMIYPEGKIIINYPNSNDQWRQGDIHEINWDCSGYTGDFVKIILIKDDGNGNYEFYCDLTPDPIQNSGSYSWTVKSDIEIGNDYRIAVYDLTNAANASKIFSIVGNDGPNTPDTPQGPSYGKTGKEYTFTSITTDPENGDVYYLFDWSDQTENQWLGPYASGEKVTAKHIWKKEGYYAIKVKAKDLSDTESGWSEPKVVQIEKGKSKNCQIYDLITKLIGQFPLFERILKLILDYIMY